MDDASLRQIRGFGTDLLMPSPRRGSVREAGVEPGMPTRIPARPPIARRCDDLAARLRELVAEADGLGREVENSTDFDLVLRLIETSYAVRRALLALDPTGGPRARPVGAIGRS